MRDQRNAEATRLALQPRTRRNRNGEPVPGRQPQQSGSLVRVGFGVVVHVENAGRGQRLVQVLVRPEAMVKLDLRMPYGQALEFVPPLVRKSVVEVKGVSQ